MFFIGNGTMTERNLAALEFTKYIKRLQLRNDEIQNGRLILNIGGDKTGVCEVTVTKDDESKYHEKLELIVNEGIEYTALLGEKRYNAKIIRKGKGYSLRSRLLAIRPDLESITLYPVSDSFELNISKQLERLKPEEGTPAYDFLLLSHGERNTAIEKRAERIGNREAAIKFTWGPPGSGKTRKIIEEITTRSEKGERVLALANTNISIDDISGKLKKTGGNVFRIGKGGNIRESEIGALLENLEKGSIVCMTVAKALILYPNLFKDDEPIFNSIFLDEAGIVKKRHFTAISFLAGNSFLIYGDPKQLAPIEDEENMRSVMIYDELGISADPNFNDGNVCSMLTKEFRMNREISEFISNTFYLRKLKYGKGRDEKLSKSIMDRIFPSSLCSLDISLFSSYTSKLNGSYLNFVTAYFSMATAYLYLKLSASIREIGIATPYKAEAALIEAMAKDIIPLRYRSKLIIDTVHAFQGKEVDIMILDIPDSNPLDKPSYLVGRYDRGENRNNDSDRLLNVAISRARIKFILISNESFLNRHAKEGTSLQALLGKTYVEGMKMKKRMKALINAINLEIGEKTNAGLFGKKGDKTKLTSGSKTAWKMRKEFWNDGGEKAMYISSCFFKTSFIPTLLRNIRKANDENISIHYDKTRFKLNEKEISLFKAVYPEEMQYPFSMTFTVSECIYGAFHSVQEKVDGETIPFIVLKKYTNMKRLLSGR